MESLLNQMKCTDGLNEIRVHTQNQLQIVSGPAFNITLKEYQFTYTIHFNIDKKICYDITETMHTILQWVHSNIRNSKNYSITYNESYTV